ncbi:hypothetical protein [Acinetobacter sp. P1(2025)]|uniref:hypothetical protein n=1 Tax=Acinetobacter sp. P1(2025) TaxID=3446120 RepID=UPI003F5372AB
MSLSYFSHINFEYKIPNEDAYRAHLNKIYSDLLIPSTDEVSLEKLMPDHVANIDNLTVNFDSTCAEMLEFRSSDPVEDAVIAHIQKHKLNAEYLQYIFGYSDVWVSTFEDGDLISQRYNHPNDLCWVSSVATPYLPIDHLKFDDPKYCYHLALACAFLMDLSHDEYLVSEHSPNKSFIAVAGKEKPFIVEWDQSTATVSVLTPDDAQYSLVLKQDWMMDEQIDELLKLEIFA